MSKVQTMRVVSGIQPTGDLHLGNLLGAILRWVRMQDEAECLFFLADLHSLSEHIEPEVRRASVREMAAGLIASGIDPEKSVLFAQSAIPAHSELCWILNGTARMGWLNRMTQWKDKAGKNREGSSVALFDYPVLQAADILLYQATHVPVGEDQKQHIELTRDIALKFNADFDVELFTPPEPFVGGGTAARVMSLRDGSMKMSKSDPSEQSRIHLTDDNDAIALKIRKAKTDPDPLPDDPALLNSRPEAKNLVGIYAAIVGETPEQVLGRFAGQGFGAFKPALSDAAIALLEPLRERLIELRRDDAALDAILAAGAEKARSMAAPTLAEAYRAVGLQGLTRRTSAFHRLSSAHLCYIPRHSGIFRLEGVNRCVSNKSPRRLCSAFPRWPFRLARRVSGPRFPAFRQCRRRKARASIIVPANPADMGGLEFSRLRRTGRAADAGAGLCPRAIDQSGDDGGPARLRRRRSAIPKSSAIPFRTMAMAMAMAGRLSLLLRPPAQRFPLGVERSLLVWRL